MVGRAISHYQVLDKLGEGGMGVVYKARDTHLDRLVAIKVLPAEKVADPERKRRFIQEAKAASALNHPNIITIYDIDQAEGSDFISMEFVAGKTLDQVIPRKGLRLSEALKCAVQMADALAAAHGAGIVHRDLKPGNVMVNEQGRVKVLDFGLAKLTEAAPSDEEAPTQTVRPTTDEGTILGTTAYMSPEQAEGKRVDARSDIFSFGSVLYEMVTGRRAFQGDSKMSTLAAILEREPAPLPPEIHHDLEKLITRCLRKDPARRFQHMEDLKVALEEMKEESDSGTLAGPAPPRRSNLRWVWIAAACVIVAACAVAWLALFTGKTPPAALTAVPLTSYPGDECCPSLSPDGNQVAFSWNGEDQKNYDIYIQGIGPGTPLRRTADPAVDTSPAWSPDGQHIAFMRSKPPKVLIILIPPLGGTERVVTEVDFLGQAGPMASWLAWTPDSRWLAFPETTSIGEQAGIFLHSVETGERRRLTTPPKLFLDGWPAFSPKGDAVSFIRWNPDNTSEVYALRFSGDFHPKGDPQQLTLEKLVALTPVWSADGREIIYSAGQLMSRSMRRIRADRVFSGVAQGQAKPAILPFTGDVTDSPAISYARHRLVYGVASGDTDIWRVDLDEKARSHAARPIISSTRIERSPQLAPDGKRVVFISDRSGSFEVWVSYADGSGQEKLTSMQAPMTGSPRWSPDGEWVVFDSTASGQYELYVIAAKGGSPKRLTNNPAIDAVASWSHDGKWIHFMSSRSGQPQVWKIPAKGGEAVRVTKNGGYLAFESPDGKTFYYSRSSSTSSLWKAPVEGGEETKVLDAVRGFGFAITARGVYFIPPSDAIGRSSIHFMDSSTGKTRPIYTIEKPVLGALAVSPDGRTILYTQFERRNGDLMLVENFR